MSQKNMFAPIAVIAFNRQYPLQQTLNALAANSYAKKSDLIVYCNAPRNNEEKIATDQVREEAKKERPFKSISVVEREKHLSCATSIITSISETFAKSEQAIIFEDDIVSSPHTLKYLNICLEKYKNYQTVFNISAWAPPPTLLSISEKYPYDSYFIPRFNCWGWAGWRDRWEKIDWDIADYKEFADNTTLKNSFNGGGEDLSPMLTAQMKKEIDTWDIRMDYARFKHGCVGLNPVYSYTSNIGMGSGTHCTTQTTKYDNDLSLAKEDPILPNHIFLDEKICSAYRKVYAPPSLPIRAINKLSRMFFNRNLIST